MTRAGVKRVLNVAYRLEMRAYISRLAAQRYTNPIGVNILD